MLIEKIQCDLCGKIIKRKQAGKKSHSQFCSDECRTEGNKKGLSVKLCPTKDKIDAISAKSRSKAGRKQKAPTKVRERPYFFINGKPLRTIIKGRGANQYHEIIE